MPHLIACRVTDTTGTQQHCVHFIQGDILIATSCVGVREGAGGVSHVAAAAVLLQPLSGEGEGRRDRHGEGWTVLLQGEPKGAALVLSNLHLMALILVLKLHKVLWQSPLTLWAQGFILQLSLQSQSHHSVDIMGLHTPGVELYAALSVFTAILSAATREAEAVHL